MPINDVSNVTQASKYTTPVNGVIKLYMYEREEAAKLNESRSNLNADVGQPLEKVGKVGQGSAPTVETINPITQPSPPTLV